MYTGWVSQPADLIGRARPTVANPSVLVIRDSYFRAFHLIYICESVIVSKAGAKFNPTNGKNSHNIAGAFIALALQDETAPNNDENIK